jgi:hypothetical protein
VLTICRGISLRAALRYAERIGCFIRERRRHGELILRHARAVKPFVTSVRRRDASRALIAWLRRLA